MKSLISIMASITESEKNILITLIEKSGMKDVYLADKLGITRFTFAKKKRESHTFSIEDIIKLSELLHIDWLVFLHDMMEEKKVKTDLYVFNK